MLPMMKVVVVSDHSVVHSDEPVLCLGSSGKFNLARRCAPVAEITFQMWGTSFRGAWKHADDPASDITLQRKNSIISDLGSWRWKRVQKFRDCDVCSFAPHAHFKANIQRESENGNFTNFCGLQQRHVTMGTHPADAVILWLLKSASRLDITVVNDGLHVNSHQ